MVENVQVCTDSTQQLGLTEQNRPKQDMYRYQKEDTKWKKKSILCLDSTAVKGLFTPEFKMTENIYWGISSKHGGFQMAEWLDKSLSHASI